MPWISAGIAGVQVGLKVWELSEASKGTPQKQIGPPVIGDKINTTYINDPTADGRHYIGPDGATYRLNNNNQLVSTGPPSENGVQQYAAAQGTASGVGGGMGGEGGGGGGFNVENIPFTLQTLKDYDITDEQIGQLLSGGITQLGQNRERMEQALAGMQGAQKSLQGLGEGLHQWMIPTVQKQMGTGYDLINQAANFNVPSIDFDITDPSTGSADFKLLSNDIYELQALEIIQNAEKLLGPIPNFSNPATLNTLVNAGVITVSEAQQLGDPTAPLATKVGTLQQQFAAQGGMRTMQGPYMAAYGQTLGTMQDALAQARHSGNVDAYKLLLAQQTNDINQGRNLVAQQATQAQAGVQGLGIAGNVWGNMGNYINQSLGTAWNIGQGMYDPSAYYNMGQLAGSMPTTFPTGLDLAGFNNKTAQQQFQNAMENAKLQLQAQQGAYNPFSIGNQPPFAPMTGMEPNWGQEAGNFLQPFANLGLTMALAPYLKKLLNPTTPVSWDPIAQGTSNPFSYGNPTGTFDYGSLANITQPDPYGLNYWPSDAGVF